MPALDVWTGTTPNGTKVEYRYHQSRTGAWASRKVGDFLNTAKRVSHGLTPKQVETLFAKRRYNHESKAADNTSANAMGEKAGP